MVVAGDQTAAAEDVQPVGKLVDFRQVGRDQDDAGPLFQKLAEEAKKEVQALISDSVGEVVDEVNRQVDSLQESTNRALGKDDKEKEQGAETPQVEPEKPLEQGVET